MTVYGIEGKLYYCTAGIGGTPTWVLAPNLKNVTLTIAGKEVDLTTRANNGLAAVGVSVKDLAIEADMPLDPTDTDYLAFESAFINKSILGLAVMSGVVTAVGSRGPWVDCLVTKFDRDEQAEGAMDIKLTFKPTKSANPWQWKIITAPEEGGGEGGA